MKKITLLTLFVSLFVLVSGAQTPVKFSEEALKDVFMSPDGEGILFEGILQKHKGKTIVIDVWASWCKDCLAGLPKVKELQKENDDVVFVFLSLDKDMDKWRNGIEKYEIEGDHYYLRSGWEGPFGKFLDLDWIPRYLVVDAEQNIKIYKEITVNKNLKSSLP